jgi:hypothetical protein
MHVSLSGGVRRRQSRRRTLTLAVVGALLASMAFAAPAAAASRQTTLPSKTLNPGFGQYTVNYYGNWDVQQTRDAGKTWWLVSKMQGKGVIVGGSACRKSQCVYNWLEAKVEFLTTTGTVYRTVGLISENSCWWDYQHSSNTYEYACTATAQQLPLSVNRIRFRMRIHANDSRQSGNWVTAWSVRTVPIS